MARPKQEKQILKYGHPDYAKHDPFQNYGAGVITGASSGDEIRTPDGQRYIHAQGQWHNVHPPGGGSLPHGAYSIRWTLRPDYPKIDIYVDGNYVATTTWARTLREAVAQYVAKNRDVDAAK